MTPREILTSESARWREFVRALHHAIVVSAEVPIEWLRTGNLCHARSIMLRMGNIDVEGSLASLKRQGLPCDCSSLCRSTDVGDRP
jgi:hypothetical protein